MPLVLMPLLSFKHIDISGEAKIKRQMGRRSSTYLGLTSTGFPNLFTLVGPHNAATFCNIPRCIEQNVEWVTDCIKYLKDNKFTKISAKFSSEKIGRSMSTIALLTLLF